MIYILVLIDLLFLPYFQTIIMPFSLPIVLMQLVTTKNIRLPGGSAPIIVIMIFGVLTSVFIGVIFDSSTTWFGYNIKAAFQFLSSFAYFIFYYNISTASLVVGRIKWVALVFGCYFLLLETYFVLDPVAAQLNISHVYGRTTNTEENVVFDYRYAFMFSDPNTAGYLLLIVMMPLLEFYKKSYKSVIIGILCLLGSTFTHSRGAVVAFALGVIIWWLSSLVKRRIGSTVTNTGSVVQGLLVAFSAGVVTIGLLLYSDEGEVLSLAIDRLTDKEGYQKGGNRTFLWSLYITELIPLPLGRGYQFDVAGIGFHPHSDFIRFTYSYGIIVAVAFAFWFFRTGLRFPLLFAPALIAAAINSLVDEQKLFCAYLCFLGLFLSLEEERITLMTQGVSITSINAKCNNHGVKFASR